MSPKACSARRLRACPPLPSRPLNAYAAFGVALTRDTTGIAISNASPFHFLLSPITDVINRRRVATTRAAGRSKPGSERRRGGMPMPSNRCRAQRRPLRPSGHMPEVFGMLLGLPFTFSPANQLTSH